MQQEPMRNYLYDDGILLTGYSILRSADSAKPDQPVLLKDEVLLKKLNSNSLTQLNYLLHFSQRVLRRNISI